MTEPLVTIVTATYNQEGYIGACIESVLAQTYGNWEQVIVDDGSTDGTEAVVRSYADPRIRYLRLPHRGLAALGESYNAALAESGGSLVAVLEGDDTWPAEKLERQVPVFGAEDICLSWGRAGLIDGEGRRTGDRASVLATRPVTHYSTRAIFHRLTRVNVLTPAVTVMVRRTALERVGGFRQGGSAHFVDLPTWLAVTATCPGRVAFVNAEVGCYRLHVQQTSVRERSRMEAEHLRVVLELESALGGDALAAVGWGNGLKRSAETAAMLAEGRVRLSEGRRDLAARAFRRALRNARTVREGSKAAVGLASVATGRDLLGAAYEVRDLAARRIPRLGA